MNSSNASSNRSSAITENGQVAGGIAESLVGFRYNGLFKVAELARVSAVVCRLQHRRKPCRLPQRRRRCSIIVGAKQMGPTTMKQFSIRAMILLVITVALFFAIAQSAGHAVSAGIVFCLAMVVWSIFGKPRGHLVLCIRGGLGILGIVSIWFLAVDIYVYADLCPTCLSERKIVSHRIIGIPIKTNSDENTSDIQIVLTDLGCPCRHKKQFQFPCQRWWGLWIVACPDFRGTLYLHSDSSWHDDEMRVKIEEAARNDPDFAKRMKDLIEREDYAKFWTEYDKIIK